MVWERKGFFYQKQRYIDYKKKKVQEKDDRSFPQKTKPDQCEKEGFKSLSWQIQQYNFIELTIWKLWISKPIHMHSSTKKGLFENTHEL